MLTYPDQQAISTRDLAWNTAGTNVEALSDEAMTAAVLLDRAGLTGWNVRAVPLTTGLDETRGLDGMEDMGLKVPMQVANVATIDGTPRVIGTVGNRYNIFQNEETTGLLDTIVDDSGAHYVAGGHMKGYTKTFAVMKMPQGLLIGGEDASDHYFGVMNSHDGSGSLVAWTTLMRLRCTNMLNGSIKAAASSWRIRHTDGMRGKIEEARRALRLTFKWSEEMQVVGEQMLATPFSSDEFDRLVERLCPPSTSTAAGWVQRAEDKRTTLRYLFNEADTNALGRGTKWGAYNAFTEYADWFAPVRKNDAAARAVRTLSEIGSQNLKQNALDALIAA